MLDHFVQRAVTRQTTGSHDARITLTAGEIPIKVPLAINGPGAGNRRSGELDPLYGFAERGLDATSFGLWYSRQERPVPGNPMLV